MADHDAAAVEDFRPKFLARSTMARKAADASITYKLMFEKLADRAELKVAQLGRRWLLSVTVDGGRGQLTVRYKFYGKKQGWRCDAAQPIELIVDGIDRSEEMEGNITKALGLLAGQPRADSSNEPGVRQKSPAARANSVEVRRSTVIRV